MTLFISKTKLRLVLVGITAFLAGSIVSPLAASSGLTPITLQPGQQITIMAANLPSASPTSLATATPTAAAAPTVAPTGSTDPNAMPTASVAGWTSVWADDFNAWNPSNYFVYPLGWRDTTGNGAYTPSIMSASGGNLNMAIQTVNGVHEVAAFCPLLPGSVSAAGHNRGDLLGMRYSFRIRADAMVGYKGVPLLWPQSETWPRDGEVDGPEADFTGQPSAFVHRQNGTSATDQDAYNTPSSTNWQAWHTYVIEWVPGVRVDMWVDGTQWVHDTNRVPTTPMHLVMQFETSTAGVVPSSSVTGQVQIAWLAVWAMG